MSLAPDRLRRFLSAKTPLVVIVAACAAAFLLIVITGNPPQALGLDPAWTEVLAWGLLHHAQWGRDLVFTYGPLGLLNPNSSYVSGAFPLYMVGDIVLPCAFALVVGLTLHRATLGRLALFACAYLCCYSKLPGDISWALTPVLGTAFLLRCGKESAPAAFWIGVAVMAPVFAVIALTKFSIFPLWAICVATLTAVCFLERQFRRALVVLVVFPLALVLAWLVCSQQLGNLPLYLSVGFEVAYGYGHAMGIRAPFPAELAGVAVVVAFAGSCVYFAWRMRARWPAAISIGQYAVITLLFWLAFFTRGDEFHWPGFFAAMSLLPFALLGNRYLEGNRAAARCAVAVVLVCASVNLVSSPSNPQQAVARMRGSLQELSQLGSLEAQREEQWRQAGESAALPGIRRRVGNARVDVLTWQQGMLLLNGLNYAPRPVFQSYSAYTPRLARLNESYFLGESAPEFVMLRLDYSDGRLPASEDGLALLALLRRYRPVLSEKGFLLLERDPEIGRLAAVTQAQAHTGNQARIGSDYALDPGNRPTIGFVRIELNAFGKLYTLFFREPALYVSLGTSDGQVARHRLVRLTAASGFLLSPVVRSSQDWVQLHFDKPLPTAQSLRVDTESWWERLLFDPQFIVALQPAEVLHGELAGAPPEVRGMLYPGFNILPSSPAGLRIVEEEGQLAVFLHAPASITFQPAQGNYSISAIFGIQSSALSDPGCVAADTDGIGVSLMLHHAGNESVIWHGEIDPFHAPADRGPQHLRMEGIDVSGGDSIEYRVDPGHGGKNISCDWSYVRNLVLRRRGDIGTGVRSEALYGDGFE